MVRLIRHLFLEPLFLPSLTVPKAMIAAYLHLPSYLAF